MERALASIEGLASNSAYMADLREEIAAASHAFVGAAVTAPGVAWAPRLTSAAADRH